jgi:hypothetical protein
VNSPTKAHRASPNNSSNHSRTTRNRPGLELHPAFAIMESEKVPWGCVMGSAKEFLEYANECFEWAKTARTDQERDLFLQMANSWTAAAVLARQRESPAPQSTKDKDKGQNATA